VIYQSPDLGMTWSSFAKGIPKDATVSGIKQERNKIYITTDYHGIFLSTNGQNNWQQLASDKLNNLDINCIELEDNKLVVGTHDNGFMLQLKMEYLFAMVTFQIGNLFMKVMLFMT